MIEMDMCFHLSRDVLVIPFGKYLYNTDSLTFEKGQVIYNIRGLNDEKAIEQHIRFILDKYDLKTLYEGLKPRISNFYSHLAIGSECKLFELENKLFEMLLNRLGEISGVKLTKLPMFRYCCDIGGRCSFNSCYIDKDPKEVSDMIIKMRSLVSEL